MYHRSSLERGRATRSHHFVNVSQWTIRNDKLVLVDPDCSFSIYDLASRSENELEAKHCRLKRVQQSVKNLPINGCFVRLTENGEIVVCLKRRASATTFAKISTDQSLAWLFNANCDMIAVGSDRLYLLVLSNHPNASTRLQIRTLDTGAMSSDILVASPWWFYRPRVMSCLTATLTGDEHFLILTLQFKVCCIIDVSTGKLINILGTECSAREYSKWVHVAPIPKSPNFRLAVPQQGFYNRYWIYDYVYIAKRAAFRCILTSMVEPTASAESGVSATFRSPHYDFAHDLWFDLWLGEDYMAALKRQRESRRISIRKSWTPARVGGYKRMTIPSEKGREDLSMVVKLDPTPKDATGIRDFAGMVGGYFVFYRPAHLTLMVADFWPSW